jgi:amidase
MEELMRRPVLELAALVRDGQLSARELTEASLREIDRLEPAINAFTYVAREEALAQAAALDAEDGGGRPFRGVPIAIKDNRPVAGMPLTHCSDLWGDYRADHDAHLVRRLRDAGFVIVGKTAMPENGILPTCESRRNGPTANPWDLTRTPGGSSGGSAAAVAAGMVPIAHGNDGGGSTRIPAACCGLVGLKAARNRVSAGPDAGQSFLAVDGVLTRTTADTAAVTDVLAGYEPGDANWAPPPPAPFAEAPAHAAKRPLRIGLTLTPALPASELHPLHEQAVDAAGRELEGLGHHVEAIAAPWADRGDLLPDFTRAFGPATALATVAGGRIRNRPPTADDVEPLTWEMYVRARQQDTLTYLIAQARIERVGREIVTALQPYDAVLTPALAQRPLPTGAVHGRGPDPHAHYRRSGAFTPYTAIVNVTGLPAISLPLFQGDDGLPTAVQLIGRPAGESGLLGLAAQLEQALPWAARRPPRIPSP